MYALIVLYICLELIREYVILTPLTIFTGTGLAQVPMAEQDDSPSRGE